MKNIAEITAQLEGYIKDRARLINAYPDWLKWETDDEEIEAWVNYEYVSGQIHAMESMLGMKLTFGNEGWQEEYVQAREKASSTRWDESEED